jgi:hypothetical protein
VKASLVKFVQPGPSVNGDVLQTATLVPGSLAGSASCESLTIDHGVLIMVLIPKRDKQRDGIKFCLPLGRVDYWVPLSEPDVPHQQQQQQQPKPAPKH